MSVIAPIKNKEFVDAILSNSERVSGFDQLRNQGTQGLESTAFLHLEMSTGNTPKFQVY